ncbi:substrate-binding and VWA domain-containing protein [Sphaerisporangium perillae]|uniref:substrate-binding and VWA domain-containing protein n=1 Tax=Sphaerisporangium perillae TaxID=2935860 RepID=UPI00200D7FD5|nr:substrate-binding and VWA domain-containing protein [Sphaerisporangium perillae]
MDDPPPWKERLAGFLAPLAGVLAAMSTANPLVNARRRAIAAVALGAVLVAVLATGAYGLISSSVCGERPQLRVMAAPEIGPVLEQVARKDAESGGCLSVSVRTGSPADVADDLALRRDIMDVWVPDASVWVDLARVQGADRTLFSQRTPLARSPVIIGMPEATAAKLAASKGKPSWTLLIPTSATKKKLPKAFTTLPAPSRFASGLAALDALNSVVTDRPALLKIVQGITTNLKRSVLPSQQALFDLVERPDKGADPVIVASEQAIWRHNSARTGPRVVGLYPEEGTLALDYPYVPVTRDAAKRKAAEEFRRLILSGTGRPLLQAAGFRDAAGNAGTEMDDRHGVRAAPPQEIPAPDPMTTLRGLLSMRLLLADTRNLLLLDVSGSMGEKVPGLGATRMQAMVGVAEAGIRALPQGSDVGLWIFSTGLDGDKDYKEVVPVGPLRQRAPEVIRELHKLPGHTRGDTGLYDSLLAAFRSASTQQVRNMLSSVIVFTDGNDDDRHGISLTELLAALQKEFDPGRPVTITLIGFGEDIDAGKLEQIARVTNGVAMVAKTFDQAQQIFLQVIANRVCTDRERCASQEG